MLPELDKVELSPNGKILASGSEDTTICLWRLDTGESKVLLGIEMVFSQLHSVQMGRYWQVGAATEQYASGR
jgi:WD40 repeat protein